VALIVPDITAPTSALDYVVDTAVPVWYCSDHQATNVAGTFTPRVSPATSFEDALDQVHREYGDVLRKLAD
jgi:hypothetical protein